MKRHKIKLSDLESLLMKVADELRGKMDAAEYKEYIFGMLFIKRMSDVFDEKREQLRITYKHLLDNPDGIKLLNDILEDPQTYGSTFFVPKRARWNETFIDGNGIEQPAIKDLQNNIGQMLNKALNALEDKNPGTLTGIFKDRINFNKEVKGKQIVKNENLKNIINIFNAFPPLINDNFEFTDLLGAAYEYLLKYFADQSGKKGGQYYTPNQVVRLLVQLLDPQEGMTIYDPTAGSGGMLIQSQQYVAERGGDVNNIALYGQELDPSVVAICKMNIILHNISKYNIEFGDTITEPLNLENGQIMRFDRVIANPPFSQNYTADKMLYADRFKYGMAPTTGKKADFMFVQHMIASCKPDGKVAVVMPHGVLFRGGKEKEIRTAIINDDILEAIISLPEKLFYGTGIAASILVFNKKKDADFKNKILIINADRDYAEGKNQNYLRPEDIEKITHVFHNKIEEQNYSRIVDISEIIANDYTLKIRTYVDNTPPAEPQDVRAHIMGGIPQNEINFIDQTQGKKFSFDSKAIFAPQKDGYAQFTNPDKAAIKTTIDTDSAVINAQSAINNQLSKWWAQAQNDFSELAPKDGQKKQSYVDVRQRLLDSMNAALVPLVLLDKYQIPGVFVNWWDNIKYDLKTIMQFGWEPSLITDDDLAARYFADDKNKIDQLNESIAQDEAALAAAVEDAYSLCEDDGDDSDEEADDDSTDNKKSAKNAKAKLNEQILSINNDDEKKPFVECKSLIENLEKRIKQQKADIKPLKELLELKLELKRYGTENKSKELSDKIADLAKQADALRQRTDRKSKTELGKKQKAIEELNKTLQSLDGLLKEMGGVITEQESKTLILKKHFDLIASQLNRYIDNERRALILQYENLHNKYAVSAQQIEAERNKSLNTLSDYLTKLGYKN